MIFDDDEPEKKISTFTIGQELSGYSVSELEALVSLLNSEIDRLKHDIVNKNQSNSDAHAIFKV